MSASSPISSEPRRRSFCNPPGSNALVMPRASVTSRGDWAMLAPIVIAQ
jgi:hypothetical protein